MYEDIPEHQQRILKRETDKERAERERREEAYWESLAGPVVVRRMPGYDKSEK